jgi:hypothetical protein
MGTVNYETSKYITIGLEPVSRYDLENDLAFIEEMQAEAEAFGAPLESAIDSYIEDCTSSIFYNVSKILEKYNFTFFNISLQPGYYDGFSIQIQDEFNYYDDWTEKREALKEVTKVKSFLLECVSSGLVQCFPGWCTGYATPEESRRGIAAAVAEMKKGIKQAHTFRSYWGVS